MFSSGFGLAAAYIQDHLSAWGVKPAGDSSSYLQTVRVLGVKTTSHASYMVPIVTDDPRTAQLGFRFTF